MWKILYVINNKIEKVKYLGSKFNLVYNVMLTYTAKYLEFGTCKKKKKKELIFLLEELTGLELCSSSSLFLWIEFLFLFCSVKKKCETLTTMALSYHPILHLAYGVELWEKGDFHFCDRIKQPNREAFLTNVVLIMYFLLLFNEKCV